MDVIQPTPEQVSPTPASPMQPPNNGASIDPALAAAVANIVRSDAERRRAAEMLANAVNSPVVQAAQAFQTKVAHDLAPTLKALESQRAAIEKTLAALDQPRIRRLLDDIAQRAIDLEKTQRIFDRIAIEPPREIPLTLPPRPASAAEIRALRDEIRELREEQGDPQEMRRRIAQIDLRTQRLLRMVDPEGSSSDSESSGEDPEPGDPSEP